jgi:hypothetical protein
LRRADLIGQYVVASAMEALGDDHRVIQEGKIRLGVVVSTMAGCVIYSRRYYEEVLRDPALASPMVFPETVFNAPASHLAAILGSTGPSFSLVGDNGTFLQGLALAAQWLEDGEVDGCLVVGAEETDWVVADAARLFDRTVVQSAGAGALYLRRKAGAGPRDVELERITDSHLFITQQGPKAAAQQMRAQLPKQMECSVLFESTQDLRRLDGPEREAWSDWSGPRIAPKKVLGEAFAASAAWQCVAACDALWAGEYDSALVSVVGVNQQAIGAQFVGSPAKSPL